MNCVPDRYPTRTSPHQTFERGHTRLTTSLALHLRIDPANNTKDLTMTGTLNKALLIGHLGHDPDIRTMNSGEPVAHLSVATSEGWKNKSTSARRDATEWHRVVLYKRLAEMAGQHLKKGALVYVEGHLQTRKWTGKDGVERHTTEIVGDELRLLHRPSEFRTALDVHPTPRYDKALGEPAAGQGISF
jgi:single-strand DNA-binding protein